MVTAKDRACDRRSSGDGKHVPEGRGGGGAEASTGGATVKTGHSRWGGHRLWACSDFTSPKAVGRAAIQQGYRVIYRETHVLLEEIADVGVDGTRKETMTDLNRLLPRWKKVPPDER